MFRFTIQEDEVSKFIRIQDTLILRPVKQSDLHTHMKVMVDQREKHDPFKFVLNVKDNIQEWWITLDAKDAATYNIAVEMFKNEHQRLSRGY